jgi:hypothetical protein
MVIAAINVFNFPIGTIFGLFALYVLSRPEVEELFSNESRKAEMRNIYYTASS